MAVSSHATHQGLLTVVFSFMIKKILAKVRFRDKATHGQTDVSEEGIIDSCLRLAVYQASTIQLHVYVLSVYAIIIVEHSVVGISTTIYVAALQTPYAGAANVKHSQCVSFQLYKDIQTTIGFFVMPSLKSCYLDRENICL